VPGKDYINDALATAFEDGDIDENLYYEYVKRNDNFVPYRKMYEREEAKLETHSLAMLSLEEDALLHDVRSTEWEWRKELARRAHERSIKWSRLDHEHMFIREDHD